MQIKELIQKLRDLYDTYDDDYKVVMGEPEIVIDVFEADVNMPHSFSYKGYSHNLVFEKSSCGTYDILSTFNETYTDAEKAAKPVPPPWPFPKSGDPYLKYSQES